MREQDAQVLCGGEGVVRPQVGSLWGTARDAELVRQISGSPCIRGNTWGVDNRGLWVDRGCRAEFEVGAVAFRGWGVNTWICVDWSPRL